MEADNWSTPTVHVVYGAAISVAGLVLYFVYMYVME